MIFLQCRVNSTWPLAVVAAICFWPVAVPCAVWVWVEVMTVVGKWSIVPGTGLGIPISCMSVFSGVPATVTRTSALGTKRVARTRKSRARAPPPT